MIASSRLFICLALGLTLAARAAEETPLSKDSPFKPAAGEAAVTAGANESWEFAAVQTIDKKTSVYIYDKAAKKGRWIAVGATVDGVTVKSHDEKRDLVVINVGGTDKTLGLRKATTTASAGVASSVPVAPQPVAWNVPPPAPVPDPAAAVAAPAPVTTPAVPQPPPPAPGTVAHQEQEARMLVSDLLEIGMAQRKAYEEAQKKAAAEKAAQGQPAPQSTR